MFTIFGKPVTVSTQANYNQPNQSLLLLETLYDAGTSGTTKLMLQRKDFMGISAKLRLLKANGAIIDYRRVNQTDCRGIVKRGVGHYVLVGFIDLPEYDNQYRRLYESLAGITYSSTNYK